MTAVATRPIPPAVAALRSAPVPGRPLRTFTVAEYHRMIEAGVLTETDPVELLEGRIVYKMTRPLQNL